MKTDGRMSYKDFIFPVNPYVIHVSHQKNITEHKIPSEQNIIDSSINKNLNNTVDINKVIQTEKNNSTKKEDNDLNNINTIKRANNINDEKEKSKNDDLVNFNSKDKNVLVSNLEKDQNIKKKNPHGPRSDT